MTVKELIEVLQRAPENYVVIVDHEEKDKDYTIDAINTFENDLMLVISIKPSN